MLVYRIGKTKHADDLSGEGARLHGGRWNHKLIPCIYTSESRALALLEYTVNVNIHDIPRALSITTFKIPNIIIKTLKESDLPGDWQAVPAPSSTKNFGTKLLQIAEAAVIKIPSTVIVNEFNFIINPLHSDAREIVIDSLQDYVYDIRIKVI